MFEKQHFIYFTIITECLLNNVLAKILCRYLNCPMFSVGSKDNGHTYYLIAYSLEAK